MSNQAVNKLPLRTSLPLNIRLALVVIIPVAAALLVGSLVGTRLTGRNVQGQVPLLAALGLASWFLGLAWYGLRSLGLRGGRPLFAGIGFAVIAWLPFLLFRLVVRITAYGRGSFAGQSFFYLLLFEAFAVQLWTFGLVFRSLAEWRGAMTAAIGSGILFGMTGFLLFQEAYTATLVSFLYFMVWGILYGIIRLRTGSILGVVLVQAMQSFTAWVVFLPEAAPDPSQLNRLYLLAAAAYLIIIWRLWPKEEEDYRV